MPNQKKRKPKEKPVLWRVLFGDTPPTKAAARKKKPTGKKKRAAVKQRAANVQKRIAAEASRRAVPPMKQRVKRKADGTFNGSKPAALTPEQREAARIARSSNAAYLRGSRSAAASERRIRRELGH